MEWIQTSQWGMQSSCGRYRIAKTMGPRMAGGPSVAAYSAWVAGPPVNPYASIGWTMLDCYDTAKEAQQAIKAAGEANDKQSA